MNAALLLRLTAAHAFLFVGAAQAGSLCAAPPTPIDRRACEVARQGPDALRQFVQRMNWLHHNLDYFDYVDEATQTAWDQLQRARSTAGVKPPPVR